MKRAIAAGAAFLLLLMTATASASPAGTADNPLITLSYLNGAFADSMKTDISQTFGGITSGAMSRLDALDSDSAAYSFAPRFTNISVLQDDVIKLSMGGSLILLSGSAELTAAEGALINISTGRVTESGTQLARNQRYFCAEGTAGITVRSASGGLLDGNYLMQISEQNLPHPVFDDVIRRSWYYPAVDFVYNNGLFTGTGSRAFSPASPMTRGMFVTVLHRLEGTPDIAPAGQFTDVQNDAAYYYKAVAWASGSGIVEGYGGGLFRPDSHITREQMAAIMYRYAVYKLRDVSAADEQFAAFPDSGDVSGYAGDAMKWAVSRGIINGSGGYLRPQDTATRAQVAQIILNYTSALAPQG